MNKMRDERWTHQTHAAAHEQRCEHMNRDVDAGAPNRYTLARTGAPGQSQGEGGAQPKANERTKQKSTKIETDVSPINVYTETNRTVG